MTIDYKAALEDLQRRVNEAVMALANAMVPWPDGVGELVEAIPREPDLARFDDGTAGADNVGVVPLPNIPGPIEALMMCSYRLARASDRARADRTQTAIDKLYLEHRREQKMLAKVLALLPPTEPAAWEVSVVDYYGRRCAQQGFVGALAKHDAEAFAEKWRATHGVETVYVNPLFYTPEPMETAPTSSASSASDLDLARAWDTAIHEAHVEQDTIGGRAIGRRAVANLAAHRARAAERKAWQDATGCATPDEAKARATAPVPVANVAPTGEAAASPDARFLDGGKIADRLARAAVTVTGGVGSVAKAEPTPGERYVAMTGEEARKLPDGARIAWMGSLENAQRGALHLNRDDSPGQPHPIWNGAGRSMAVGAIVDTRPKTEAPGATQTDPAQEAP